MEKNQIQEKQRIINLIGFLFLLMGWMILFNASTMFFLAFSGILFGASMGFFLSNIIIGDKY